FSPDYLNFPGPQCSDVLDHIKLRRTVRDCNLCLGHFRFRFVRSQWKPNYGTNTNGRTLEFLFYETNPKWIDADRREGRSAGFGADARDFHSRGLRLQQGVVNQGSDFVRSVEVQVSSSSARARGGCADGSASLPDKDITHSEQ